MIFKNKEDAIWKLRVALAKEATKTKPCKARLAKNLGFYDHGTLTRAMKRFDLAIELAVPPLYQIKGA